MTLDDSPNRRFRFVIGDDGASLRLDVFLAEKDDPPISRSQVKKRIDRGEVSLNGDTPSKAGVTLRVGDVVEWEYEPPQPLSAEPEDIPLDVLFEDDHLAIVNKPAGMVVHPAPAHPNGTLVNAILHHFARIAPTSELRPGIVHRIDKDTSGAIVITKTMQAHQHLAALFHDHDIERAYHALVYGPNLDDAGTFATFHGRHPNDRIKFTGQLDRGRRATTHFRVLERFHHGCALVECRLETGRTHQIRVHLSEAGAPLLGDHVYSGKKIAETKLIGRQALHARTLGFHHVEGSDVLVTAPYPEDFAAALESLRDGKHW